MSGGMESCECLAHLHFYPDSITVKCEELAAVSTHEPSEEGVRGRISLSGSSTYACSTHNDLLWFQGKLLSFFSPCIKNVWGICYLLDPRYIFQTTGILLVTSRGKNQFQETIRFKVGTILCPLKGGGSDLSRLDLT